MTGATETQTIYERLGVRRLINARGAITGMGGSIMPPEVVEAMAQAGSHYVYLTDLQEKAGARIAELTGAEAAFVSSGAASGMLLAGAACLTGTDEAAVAALPDVGGRPNEFIISMVDRHHYIHQGFRVCGGTLVRAGTEESVSTEDYALAVSDRTAALVFFLGKQPKAQLAPIIDIAHERGVPVIVDAAAQLPPRANLTDITSLGADLVVFSGGKGLRGPQCTGIVLGREDLVRAGAMNISPNSSIGRGMKVGKEEIAGVLAAVELFMGQDEDAVLREWEARCHVIADALRDVDGLMVEDLPAYANPEGGVHAPATPLVHLHFGSDARLGAAEVKEALEAGDPGIVVDAASSTVTIDPMPLLDGQAEIIAARLREVLS